MPTPSSRGSASKIKRFFSFKKLFRFFSLFLKSLTKGFLSQILLPFVVVCLTLFFFLSTSIGQKFLLDSFSQLGEDVQNDLTEKLLYSSKAQSILDERLEKRLEDAHVDETKKLLEEFSKKIDLLERQTVALRATQDIEKSVVFFRRIIFKTIQTQISLGESFSDTLELALSTSTADQSIKLGLLLPYAETGVISPQELEKTLLVADKQIKTENLLEAKNTNKGLWQSFLKKFIRPIRIERTSLNVPISEVGKDIQKEWDTKGLSEALKKASEHASRYPVLRQWITLARQTAAAEKVIKQLLEEK